MLRRTWRLFVAFILSSIAASAAQVQLGIMFKADVELVAAMMILVLMTLIAIVVFAIALAARWDLLRTALWLFAGVVAIVAALGVVTFVESRGPVGFKRDLPVLLYVLVPAAVMILVQWMLLRRIHAPPPGAKDQAV